MTPKFVIVWIPIDFVLLFIKEGLIKLLIRKETVEELLQTVQGGGNLISRLLVKFWIVLLHAIINEEAVHSIAERL